MKSLRVICPFCILAVVLLSAATASATPAGTLNVTSGNGTLTISLESLIFNLNTAGNPAGPPWNGQVTNATFMQFAGCPSGVLGTPGCLDAAPFSPAEAVLFANGNPIVLGSGLATNNPFIQFAGNGVTHVTVDFFASSFGPGSSNLNCAGLGIGDSCSIFAGDPLILTMTAAGTELGLSLSGTVTDGAGTSTWVGGINEFIAGMTPDQIQLFFCPTGTCIAADFTSGKSLTKAWSGNFVATAGGGNTGGQTPEPSSLLLLATGAAGMLGFARRYLA